MKTSLLPAAAALLLAGTGCGSRSAAPAPEPIRLIVETDMGNDIDDALAFDLIYKAMDDGRVDLLAIGNHKLSPTATDYIDILNTWYGYPDIPLAQSPTPVLNDHAPDYTAAVCAMTREDGSPAFAPEQDPGTDRRPRHALPPHAGRAARPLGNRTFFRIRDRTGKTPRQPGRRHLAPHGPRTGGPQGEDALDHGGSYGEKQRAEFNVVNDIPAMRKLFAEWTRRSCRTPSSWESKSCIPVRPSRTISAGRNSTVVEGYKNYHKMPYDRASWDLLSVVYLLHPEYFTESEPGTVAVDDKGFTNFSPGPDGRHRWLTATPEQLTRLRDCIVRTTTRAPKHTEL